MRSRGTRSVNLPRLLCAPLATRQRRRFGCICPVLSNSGALEIPHRRSGVVTETSISPPLRRHHNAGHAARSRGMGAAVMQAVVTLAAAVVVGMGYCEYEAFPGYDVLAGGMAILAHAVQVIDHPAGVHLVVSGRQEW